VAERTGARRPVHLLLVVVVIVVVNGLAFPSLTQIFKPLGDFGLDISSNWSVTAVEPGGAADLAGLRALDHVDATALTLGERLALVPSVSDTGFVPAPGQRITMRYIRGSTPHMVTLEAQPQRLPTAIVADIIFNRSTALIFGIIAGLLFLLKPSRMTLAFLGFAVGSTAGSPTALTHATASAYFVGEVFVDILAVIGAVGFLVFLLRFPDDAPVGWRLRVDIASPYILLALAAAVTIIDYRFLVVGRPVSSLVGAFEAILRLVTTGGLVALLSTYLHMHGEGRQRIRWVAASLLVYYAADLAIPHVHTEYNYMLRVLYLAVPFSVAYAVLRHRVIDVNFFISRALVFGVLTRPIAALFTLLDFFLVRVLDAGRIGLAVEIVVALGVGAWLNGLHREIDPIIDRLFFQKRYLGEQRLERAANVLPYAETVETIDDYLIREPMEALDLTSAALFVGEGGRFVRQASSGWADNDARELLHDDRITLNLTAEQTPLRLREVHRMRADLPQGPAAPGLAVPVLVRRRLKAIVLYGSHSSGADLDVDEIQCLEGLSHAAAAAYDHLEAVTLRQLVTDQRHEIETLRSAPASAD
jgi:hypothetical protein